MTAHRLLLPERTAPRVSFFQRCSPSLDKNRRNRETLHSPAAVKARTAFPSRCKARHQQSTLEPTPCPLLLLLLLLLTQTTSFAATLEEEKEFSAAEAAATLLSQERWTSSENLRTDAAVDCLVRVQCGSSDSALLFSLFPPHILSSLRLSSRLSPLDAWGMKGQATRQPASSATAAAPVAQQLHSSPDTHTQAVVHRRRHSMTRRGARGREERERECVTLS